MNPRKALIGAMLGLAFLGAAQIATAEAASLTSSQVNSIVGMLQSFGVGQSTIDAVRTALGVPVTAPLPPSSSSCVDLTHNLGLHDTDAGTGGDVTRLQTFLIGQGDLTGTATGYFGPLTLAAVKKWQSDNGVVSSGTPETTGYGFVGKKTRAAMGCSTMIVTPPTSSTVPSATLTASDGITSGANITVNPGATITYTWSSTNGSTYAAVLTPDVDGTCDWSAGSDVTRYQIGNSASGSETSSALGSCWNGHTFNVVYTVTSASGQSTTARVTVNVRSASVSSAATFIASPTSGQAPLVVQFTSTGAPGTDVGSSIDFGDDTTGSLDKAPICASCNPVGIASHTYTAAGTYTATLLSSSGSTLSTATVTVTAGKTAAPTVTLSANGAGSATVASGGSIVYAWTSTNGSTYKTTTTAVTTHCSNWTPGVPVDVSSSIGMLPSGSYTTQSLGSCWASGDSFYVTYTVTSASGQSTSASVTVNVESATAPSSTLTASPTSGTAPLAVTFTALVSDASTGLYTVTFGDGTTGTLFGSCITSGDTCIAEGTASHTYQTAGTYTATLLKSGVADGTATVTVTSGTTQSAPTITSVSPTTGSGIVPITITGTGFDKTTNYVTLAGGTVCGFPTPIASSDTMHLTCSLSLGATSPGTYSLKVRNGATNLYSNSLNFTVGTPATPVISSISPTSATPGTSMTITGTGFDTTATNDIDIGGTHVRNVASTGGTKLTFALPSVAPGTYSVSVSNSAGVISGSGATLTVTPSASAPVISTVTGAGGLGFTAGTSISTVITGTGFDPSSNWVSFNGGGIGNYPSTSNGTQISFTLSTVGVAAGTYPLMVRNNTNNLYSNSFNIAVGAQTTGSPTAGLSVQYVNGLNPANSSDVTVNPGDNLTYVWSSTGGTSATATFTVDSNDACGDVAGTTYTWNANGSLGGSSAGTIPSCEAGHTYTITYRVTGTVNGLLTTASATITIRVASTAPTATLTVSDGITTGTNITVNPGAAITYTWSSTNGTSYSSELTAPSGGCFTSLDTSSVIGSSNTNGIRYAYTSSPLGSCWNGHSYTETFTVTGSGGQQATASATVNVSSTVTLANPSSQTAGVLGALQQELAQISREIQQLISSRVPF